jgi:hypothetical protein
MVKRWLPTVGSQASASFAMQSGLLPHAVWPVAIRVSLMQALSLAFECQVWQHVLPAYVGSSESKPLCEDGLRSVEYRTSLGALGTPTRARHGTAPGAVAGACRAELELAGGIGRPEGTLSTHTGHELAGGIDRPKPLSNRRRVPRRQWAFPGPFAASHKRRKRRRLSRAAFRCELAQQRSRCGFA